MSESRTASRCRGKIQTQGKEMPRLRLHCTSRGRAWLDDGLVSHPVSMFGECTKVEKIADQEDAGGMLKGGIRTIVIGEATDGIRNRRSLYD